VIIIGAGVSGCFIANELSSKGFKCLILEAGLNLNKKTYPIHDVLINSKMYWSGGAELNNEGTIAFLRPKVVGGGSIVNQALLDRFDSEVLDDWRSRSQIDFLSSSGLSPYYTKAESNINMEEIPAHARNKNAGIFIEGMTKNGFITKPLTRAQKGCNLHEPNDCIECLSGCRLDQKQSMAVTVLPGALSKGAELISSFEVKMIEPHSDGVRIFGLKGKKESLQFKAKKIVLASGAIGNSKLLLQSGFNKFIPAIGNNFYTHPQFMSLGLYKEKIESFKLAFQSFKSQDPQFKKWGFKLENVFAPPNGIAMLIPGFGRRHLDIMKKIPHMACIEVAVRDTNPGKIKLGKNGALIVEKTLNEEDKKRKLKGMEVIDNIFDSTGAQSIIRGKIGIGLHLMGGCGIGQDEKLSVTTPDFHLHGFKNIHLADSSIFPAAPGINPSLTIMALSIKASENIAKGF
jgi:choline dehydrogenase-like flavoprotein